MFKPLILILLGVVYAGYSAKHLMDDRALEQHGKMAVVEPIAQYTQTTHKKGLSERREYDANVTFKTESGETVTVKKKLSVDLIEQFASGGRVSIRYLPENPRVTRLGAEGKMSGVDIGMGLLALIGGVFWFRRNLYASG